MKTNADAISVAGTDAAAILVHTTFSCRVGTRTWVWIDFFLPSPPAFFSDKRSPINLELRSRRDRVGYPRCQ